MEVDSSRSSAVKRLTDEIAGGSVRRKSMSGPPPTFTASPAATVSPTACSVSRYAKGRMSPTRRQIPDARKRTTSFQRLRSPDERVCHILVPKISDASSQGRQPFGLPRPKENSAPATTLPHLSSPISEARLPAVNSFAAVRLKVANHLTALAESTALGLRKGNFSDRIFGRVQNRQRAKENRVFLKKMGPAGPRNDSFGERRVAAISNVPRRYERLGT